MDANNRYILEFAAAYTTEHPDAAILDFGCGTGRLVRNGISTGLNIVGADVFYDTTAARDKAALTDLLGQHVHEIVDGRVPFPDGHFDLVVNNQVMEHVDDLDLTINEISRVLKPGGTVLSIFPTLDVWREPHIGIPFSHRFPKNSSSRYYYTLALRSLRIGDTKKTPYDRVGWTREWLDWLDTYTRYRSRREIFDVYDRHFQNTLIERENICFRLREKPGGRQAIKLMALPGATRTAEAVFRKFAFVVILSVKPVENALRAFPVGAMRGEGDAVLLTSAD